MLTILMPLAGRSDFFPEDTYHFGKYLVEIEGEPMVGHAIRCLSAIEREKSFVFVVRKDEASRFFVDRTLSLLTDGNCETVVQQGETKGAACSCLLAINHIPPDDPLIVANADQIIDWDLNAVLSYFEEGDFDAGTICFESVHPRWSYVAVDEQGEVVEAAEKKPISRNAIAGFYYYRRGSDFIQAAMKSILCAEEVQQRDFISPCFNELILDGKRIGMVKIPQHRYHSFYSPQRIRAFER